MLNIILFDTDARSHLLPLTATRPTGELRLGILLLREKWERYLRGSVSYITQEYLQQKYPIHIEEDNLIVSGNIVPDEALCRRLEQIQLGDALLRDGELVAARLNESQIESLIEDEQVGELHGTELEADFPLRQVSHLWDFTPLNGAALVADFALLTAGRRSQTISITNQLVGPIQNLFVEAGVSLECCILNVSAGPVYIGENAVVMEGSMLRGPLSIGANAIVKMGAKIYGPTTIGPGCRVGGEVTRSILFANSNKSHDGFLGDAVLGEWCNLGADTNNSNLKNNYSEVKLWDYATERFEKTGQQFMGLIMGDHAKCGINTMFNTGTVVGAFANVFGAGYPRNFIPDFAWGGPDSSYRSYKLEEACITAATAMARRQVVFTELDKAILQQVFTLTAKYRTWEKGA